MLVDVDVDGQVVVVVAVKGGMHVPFETIMSCLCNVWILYAVYSSCRYTIRLNISNNSHY